VLGVNQQKKGKKRDQMGIFRGQGATEYLVLLAVVLIVALVSVALLGFIPGMASDVRITQSQSYWRGQARPFAILDAQISGDKGNFTMQNMEAVGSYNLTTMAINNNNLGINNSGANSVMFGPGETKIVVIYRNIDVPTCTPPGSIYNYNVTITYTSPSGIAGMKQYSAKNLVGRCN
jgi:hypothetical protein